MAATADALAAAYTASAFDAACPLTSRFIAASLRQHEDAVPWATVGSTGSDATFAASAAMVAQVLQLMLRDGTSCLQMHGVSSVVGGGADPRRGLAVLEGDGTGVTSSVAFNIIMALICLLMAGLASGLTQGLLSLDLMEMKITARRSLATSRALSPAACLSHTSTC